MTVLSDLNDEYGIKLRENGEYHNQVYAMRYLEGKIRNGKNVIPATIPFPQIKFAWCVYQGRKESGSSAFFLQELGVRAGVHDINIIYVPPKPELSGFTSIEMKYGKNGLSDHQKNFGFKMDECGHRYGVAWSVANVRDYLIDLGLECKNRNCIEPPRSELERREAAFSFYQRPPR